MTARPLGIGPLLGRCPADCARLDQRLPSRPPPLPCLLCLVSAAAMGDPTKPPTATDKAKGYGTKGSSHSSESMDTLYKS